jgi:hypothetical protein
MNGKMMKPKEEVSDLRPLPSVLCPLSSESGYFLESAATRKLAAFSFPADSI